MRRILWLSRHQPTPDQERELSRLFGQVDIVVISKTVSSGEDVLQLFDEHNCHEMVVVLPVTILAELVGLLKSQQREVRPIRAVMNREVSPSGEAMFSFLYFERVEDIIVKTTKLD